MKLTFGWMVRCAASLGVLFAAWTGVASAQYRPSPTGFGRVLFPGGTAPAGVSSGAQRSNPFGRVLFPGTGGPSQVVRPGNSNSSGNVLLPAPGRRNRYTPIVVPFPVFYGNGLFNNGYSNYDAPPAQIVNYTPPVYPYGTNQFAPATSMDSQAPPTVIINQYFSSDGQQVSNPKVSTNSQPQTVPRSAAEVIEPPPAPQQQTQSELPMFLIAMKDHTIFAANAYWIEAGTLNYITMQGSTNSASMELVDRELSRRLNRDRNVAFGLPQN